MVKKKKAKVAKKKAVNGETKEGKLVKLLSNGKSYSLKEIVMKTGFAEASAKMYVSQDYLTRKEKPYKVLETMRGKIQVFKYKGKSGKK